MALRNIQNGTGRKRGTLNVGLSPELSPKYGTPRYGSPNGFPNVELQFSDHREHILHQHVTPGVSLRREEDGTGAGVAEAGSGRGEAWGWREGTMKPGVSPVILPQSQIRSRELDDEIRSYKETILRLQQQLSQNLQSNHKHIPIAMCMRMCL